MTAQIEVELSGMCDTQVDGGTGGYVATLARLLSLFGAEQTRVVTLLYYDECYTGLVFRFQLQNYVSLVTIIIYLSIYYQQ